MSGLARHQRVQTHANSDLYPRNNLFRNNPVTRRRNPIPACNCDKGFECGVGDKGQNYSQESYSNGTMPVPHTSCTGGYSCGIGLNCPTGTQFPVPFDYGYGQQVSDRCTGTLRSIAGSAS